MKTYLTNMIFCKKRLLLSLSIAFLSNLPVTFGIETPNNKNEMLSELIKLNDIELANALKTQWTDKNAGYYGAVFDGDSVVSPIETSYFIQTLMCSYASSSSKYYRSKEILHRMTLAASGLLNLQHEDGTIDLISTNFHSTPDLGFTIYPLALAYSIMLKNKQLNYGEFPSIMKQYLLKAGDALSVGGVHTPNHRWVISGALAWIDSFFPDPKFKARVDQWLAEKIDIDPDGQYHERSTAVYTPVTNRSLIDMAQKMGYENLYDDIRKNLDMTFYYVHANGEIVTESSNRQDKYRISNMSGYYLAYNYMALNDKDSRYSGMVKYIENNVPIQDLSYMLPYFLSDSSLFNSLPEPTPLPTTYHKYFKHSDIARIREGKVDMSVLTNNSTFFTYFKGQAALEAVRLSASFFGKGQFQSQKMEKEGDTYVLSSTIYGPYYQPLPKEKIPAEGEAWGQVPRTEREQSEVQTLSTKIYITEREGKANVKVVVDGPKNLPVTLELGFRMGGTLRNVNKKQGIDNAWLMKNGEFATYQYASDTIKVEPAVSTHKWTQLRGALPKLPTESLYMTNYAPCEFEFTIE
ncbi:MAG: hypothetical protein Q7W54_16730 [Bacteroidota bacterium]|nr:hypothetical protein [Bacteroidota bacterium]